MIVKSFVASVNKEVIEHHALNKMLDEYEIVDILPVTTVGKNVVVTVMLEKLESERSKVKSLRKR